MDGVPGPAGFTPIQHCTPELLCTSPSAGCSCSPVCDASCPCGMQEPWGRVYSAEGCLIPVSLGVDVEGSLRECGPGCACRGSCTPARSGRQPALHLERMPGKGWGVVVDEDLPAGRFVCEYVGERITTEEAGRRLADYDAAARGHALLVFREILPSGQAALRLNIDATRKGNIAAFFNHRYDAGMGRGTKAGEQPSVVMPATAVLVCPKSQPAAATACS